MSVTFLISYSFPAPGQRLVSHLGKPIGRFVEGSLPAQLGFEFFQAPLGESVLLRFRQFGGFGKWLFEKLGHDSHPIQAPPSIRSWKSQRRHRCRSRRKTLVEAVLPSD